MLGASSDLRDLRERKGYDRIFLGIEVTTGEKFTIVRSTGGGEFKVFDGLHEALPLNDDGLTLKERHSGTRNNNLSRFLLAKIGLDNKRIRKNSSGETQSLSFRNVARLCLITEGAIQRTSSPLESGRPSEKTADYATFKAILTGSDDSSLIATSTQSSSPSHVAKMEIIDELLLDLKGRLTSSDLFQVLSDNLAALEEGILYEQSNLDKVGEQLADTKRKRADALTKLEEVNERNSEIRAIINRFLLLDTHYQSDLERLEGIREVGSLIAAMSPQRCPLCGADSEHHQRTEDCDGNLDVVVNAADIEISKILRLRRELLETIRQLQDESGIFEQLVPKLNSEIIELNTRIQLLTPDINQRQISYSDLVDRRASIRSDISIWEQIFSLQTKRDASDNLLTDEDSETETSTDISSTVLDQFASRVQQILKNWSFPDADGVFFDQRDRDLIISGRRRGSRGKGMRAITHASFTIGLMEFCERHPGFVILDSPLLAYREPEGTVDDLSGTDVKIRFYDYLSNMTEGQVIVIENTDPPDHIVNRPTTTFFSKNENQGRAGLFPAPQVQH